MFATAAQSTLSPTGQANHVAKLPQPRTPSTPLDLERLFREARPRLLAIAQRVLGDADDAEDAVQDALVKAWQKVDRFEGRSSFTTWMHRITVNAALDQRRRRATAGGGAAHVARVSEARVADAGAPAAAEAGASGGAGPETPERLYARAESSALVQRALGRLPPPQSAALRLRDLDGESYSTIATIERCPLGTVMSRLYHARRKLAAEIGAAASGDEDLEALRAA